MNKTLNDVKLIELMPSAIRNDPQIIAACESIEPDLSEIKRLMVWTEIYSRIDELPPAMIELLAWENQMLGAEWAIAGSLSKRRELVKNSYLLNRLRGTRWSFERVFQILGIRAEISEWYEHGGDPFTFKITVLDVSDVGLSIEMQQWLISLIYAYKPVSRHITATNMTNNLPNQRVFASVGVSYTYKIEV